MTVSQVRSLLCRTRGGALREPPRFMASYCGGAGRSGGHDRALGVEYPSCARAETRRDPGMIRDKWIRDKWI